MDDPHRHVIETRGQLDMKPTGTRHTQADIRGLEKTITFPGTAVDAGEGTLRVTGTHELRMTEYGLKPPTLMLGSMKVGDKVTVAFDLLLKD